MGAAMTLQLLKYLLLALNLIALGFGIFATATAKSRPPAGEAFWIFIVLAGLGLNLIYLLRTTPPQGEFRIFQMLGLWFDAKENELRERAKRAKDT